ncbi:germination protein YpeB [Amphibacillus xylanus]|uniref:Spore germination protein n=1 Tax=Amphibacillus xylanus (strain ATCC 51415 / DSM 6626 / JCM 7361 / LMG 17667 / NBRC 15112 / Ep01) TaxID=698758 RepID=K0J7F4_AMPXN|nr:germination protein YpeB [Amphibacillus xylanus]BAM47358.1 spore germination protein [Amphibacillus xylanus NBRC 15112]
MRRWISIIVLSIALVFTAFWGYRQFNDKELLIVQAENNYQRAFHDLTYHIDLLYDKIGTTLALNSKDTLSPQMIEIWTLSSQAQSDVSQLPLGLLPFTKTETFLADIGEFTYHVAIRDLDNEPLNDEEIDRLSSLYESANEIRKELRSVQHKVFSDGLKWVEVEMALAKNDRETPNHIIDGFTAVEDYTSGFDESHFDNLSADLPSQQDRFRYVDGDPITEKEVKELIMKQFDLTADLDIELQKSGDGAQLPTYSGGFTHEDERGYIEVTESGGHVLSYMINRDLGKAKISLHDAEKEAEKVLKQEGFEDVRRLKSSQYDETGLFQFAVTNDDVWIYPDRITVKVALDNGDIIGFNATDYYRNHHDREIKQPKLSFEEAKQFVSPSLNIEDQHLAIIEDKAGNEILTYAFFGTLNHDTYQIFIDADTGKEIFVELMHDVESKWG